MNTPDTCNLSVREMQAGDVHRIVDYWLDADPDFLVGMGVDLAKMPSRTDMTAMLSAQLTKPYPEKQSYCIIWEIDRQPVGHCNVNKIVFGEEAYMHLHVWTPGARKQGAGLELVKMSLPFFFQNLELKNLFCEPYALNPAPNKTLEKAGFEFLEEYVTVPGYLNFEQPVKRWRMSRERFNLLLS